MTYSFLEKQAEEIGVDVETLIELYSLFFDQTDSDLIRFNTVIKSKDIQNVKDIAHHIKGACLSLELSTLFELAGDMEKLSEKEVWDEITSLLIIFTETLEEKKLAFNRSLNE